LFAVYGYAAVIYCDFSGYSDIALGIARWLGFTLPTNFLSPYQSSSITEFWRRWHISLSSWLRDYLYIPLGGNKKGGFATYFFALLFITGVYLFGKHLLGLSVLWSGVLTFFVLLIFILPALLKKDKTGISTSFNLLSTMLLGGLWHGASWNFIIWGALHGIALGIHKIWMLITGKASEKLNRQGWYKAIAIFITFHFVCFCWVFFKSADFATGMTMLHQIGYDFSFSVWPEFFDNYKWVIGMILLAGILHAIPDGLADKLIGRTGKWPLLAYVTIFFLFVLLYGYFKSAEQVMPIYLQF
jgi:D-alanyl-lipoteichoic acid acyltransferase DltB (MBOAT superfamily)